MNDYRVKIIHFIRNFGQHNATLCGFNYSCGDFLITLDDDLQHPPEEIPKLIAKINEGFSVVYGRYGPKNPSVDRECYEQNIPENHPQNPTDSGFCFLILFWYLQTRCYQENGSNKKFIPVPVRTDDSINIDS